MAKFKVGDVVRVRTDLVVDKMYGNAFFTPKMEIFRGNIYRVKEVMDYDSPEHWYKLDLPKGSLSWTFSESMLEESSYRDSYYTTLKFADCFPNYSEHSCDSFSYVFPSLYSLKRKSVMEKVKDLFKSKQQKLFEKYLFDDNGNLDWSSPILQKVILVAFKKELLTACMEEEK